MLSFQHTSLFSALRWLIWRVDGGHAPHPAHTSDVGTASLVRIVKYLYIVIGTRLNDAL
jgi:hypothetical protein